LEKNQPEDPKDAGDLEESAEKDTGKPFFRLPRKDQRPVTAIFIFSLSTA